MKFGYLLGYVNLFCVGLLAGSAFTFVLGLCPIMENLSISSYVEFHQALEGSFSCKLPALYGGTLLLLAFTLFIKRKSWRTLTFALVVCAFLCIADELIMTVNGSSPLGKSIQAWQVQQLPQDWVEVRVQWLRFIYWRAALLVSAFILLLISTGLNSWSKFPGDAVDVWEQRPGGHKKPVNF